MKGFTLIEVVISIAIGLLATGIILVNYNSYNDTQTLKQAGLTLKNNLRFAQEKAVSGVKPNSVCSQLSGYSVTFTASSYIIQALCNPEGVTGDTTTVTLPTKDISFTPIPTPLNMPSVNLPGPSSFAFEVLSRGTSLESPLTITMIGFGKHYQLVVSPGGDISEQ